MKLWIICGECGISFARQLAEQGWKVERITIGGEVEDWDEAAA